jgi:hypothetical protein
MSKVVIPVKWPYIQSPNDGYDDDGKWCGFTPAEVGKKLTSLRQLGELRQWKPASDEPAN